ncbi:MAG TPA: DoxX family protein [Paludibaculum sp.]|jgi:putative oxidoreductase
MRGIVSQDILILAGRILLSLIFVVSAIGKTADWCGTAGYMASKRMVAIPFFLPMAILVEATGGLAVLTGLKARWGAMALFLFLIPVTMIFLDFLSAADAEKQLQTIQFMKNLAIMGGLLTVAAFGPGRFSVGAGRREGK